MSAGDIRDEPRNGWGTAALVCGLVALVVGFVPVAGDIIALPLALAAVGSGGVGLMRAEDGRATNPGVALTGALLGFAAGLLSFLTIVSAVTS